MTAFPLDHPPLSLADQIDLAERRFCHALVNGWSREAARWTRVIDLLFARLLRELDAEPRTTLAAPPPTLGRESRERKNLRLPPAPRLELMKARAVLRRAENQVRATARAPP